ncbi:MAG TPA: hypothetical protein VHP54_05485 [Caproiciproducens sp.]|nr:hypothetical protein [Caproiciproducens sp.]
MKRIKSACLEQTIHFQLNANFGHAAAVSDVKAECEQYKAQLERKHIKFRIEGEPPQPDGSIIIKIKKQFNRQNCDEYLA